MKNNLQKFLKHLKSGGLIYAIARGTKYLAFLFRKFIKQDKNIIIRRGRIALVYEASYIRIFWDDIEVTKHPGLNVAINTLGLWTDSTKADCMLIEKNADSLKIKIVFRELPLSQIWTLSVREGFEIGWEVRMEVEERLHIDEIRIISMINPNFKMWFNGYQQVDFPPLRDYFQDLLLGNNPESLVGVRFPLSGVLLPSLTVECLSTKKEFFPLIQRSPLDIDASIVGFRTVTGQERNDFPPGNYNLFSGRINLYQDDHSLDRKIENRRRICLDTAFKEVMQNNLKEKKPKVLLANLPWLKEGKWGVRAGSRWPHVKSESEGNYLPFPFFLAYATSLLKKNGFPADMSDFIADQTAERQLMEKVSLAKPDILVIETSVPSFYYDMQLLSQISSLGTAIVLCGPQPDIYEPGFLLKNKFIKFILFGEYEFTLLELVKELSKDKKDFSSIKGLIWRNCEGQAVKNSAREPFDINLLPWPQRDGLPMQKYWDLPGNIPHPSVQMVASRGCPFTCNFCLWPQLLFGGRTYRTRDVIDVVDEMENLVREKGFKSVYFDDDTFNVGKERIIRLCDEIIKRGLNNVPWAIMAKADLMDEEMLDKLKEAGLHAVKYGLESSSQDLLDRCGKKLDLRKAEKMIKYTKSIGIKTHLTFAFGLPGETKETVKSSIDYALRLDPQSAQFSIITPFPGTALFKELENSGRILTKDWSLYDGHYKCIFQPENFSPDFLEQAKEYAYRVWVDYKRQKRGFWGDVNRFVHSCQSEGMHKALKKTKSYLNYIIFDRDKFIGKF